MYLFQLLILNLVSRVLAAQNAAEEEGIKAYSGLQLIDPTSGETAIAEYVIAYDGKPVTVFGLVLDNDADSNYLDEDNDKANATTIIDAAAFTLKFGKFNDFQIDISELPFNITVSDVDPEEAKGHSWDSCSRVYKNGNCDNLAETFNYNYSHSPTYFDTDLPRSSAGLSNYRSSGLVAAAYYSNNYQQGSYSAISADSGYTVCMTPNAWYVNSITMQWAYV